MGPLSMPKLVLKRISDDRILLLSIFIGITIATTVMATAPVYLRALERLALNIAIDRLERPFSNINTFSYRMPVTAAELERSERAVAGAVEQYLLPIQDNRERYVLVDTFLAGLPQQPMPQSGSSARGDRSQPTLSELDRDGNPTVPVAAVGDALVVGALGTGERADTSDGGRPTSPDGEALSSDGQPANRAGLRYLSHLEDHVRFIAGRMARNDVVDVRGGPLIEAVISLKSAADFSVDVGDIITVAPSLGTPDKVFVRVVGIVEATDPWEDFWQPHASIFLDPSLQQESSSVEDIETLGYDPETPAIPLFTTLEALSGAVGETYHGIIATSIWFMMVDKERLKEWPLAEALGRLDDYETQVTKAMPGSEVLTRVTEVLNRSGRRSFFSRVPLVLLLTVMVAALLFYLSMMTSYLVESRQGDSALLVTRGLGTWRLLQLYVLEGLVMTAMAVLMAPWIAIAAVALTGKLPYFREMTKGDLLPVEMGVAPFLLALAGGLLCLAMYVVPGMLGARGGLLVHKLRTTRPPSVPFFHRYHLDVALLGLGGLVFWELHNRGHLISGGLFKEVEVNETLLLAPVLFLATVGLVFMRFFPLVVRFISGESPALVHLLTPITLAALASIILVGKARASEPLAGLAPAALLLAIGSIYWATSKAQALRFRMAGIVVQAGLTGAFLTLEPPAPGEAAFVPTLLLMLVVPAQVAFLLLRMSARATPVWLLMGLRRMARNPLQYTRLVMLLVLVTGVGVLAATVGGSLERNQQDRIQYNIASDIRVTDIIRTFGGGARSLKEKYMNTAGVTAVSMALRDKRGGAGTATVEVLGLESQEFQYVSWYRDDFSSLPLGGVMEALRSHAPVHGVTIPEGAHTIGVWARPEELYPSMSIWVVVEDVTGKMTTLSLGRVGPPEWHLIETKIPNWVKPPLNLVSVQVYEPGHGPVMTPGTLLLDDIHVKAGPRNEEHVLVDFETLRRWMPIANAAVSPDRLLFTREDPYRGEMSGAFNFGRDNEHGVRGFYRSPTGGPLPVVVSASFAEATGTEVGQVLIASIADRRIPVVVRDTVSYFPTMNTNGGRFMLADLDNMLAHLNVVAHLRTHEPNELFLKGTPDMNEAVRAAMSLTGGFSGSVRDRDSQMESARLDPLTAAGWRSLVLLSLGVVVLAAVLGYVTHLLSFASRTEGEMGYLKSLGFSRRQLLGLLGFEHLAIVAIGLGLGTWAGFQMSRLMVASVSLTETGERAIPPFLLITDWPVLLPAYAAMLATFVAVLFAMNRGMDRLDLQAISRVEGL